MGDRGEQKTMAMKTSQNGMVFGILEIVPAVGKSLIRSLLSKFAFPRAGRGISVFWDRSHGIRTSRSNDDTIVEKRLRRECAM